MSTQQSRLVQEAVDIAKELIEKSGGRFNTPEAIQLAVEIQRNRILEDSISVSSTARPRRVVSDYCMTR